MAPKLTTTSYALLGLLDRRPFSAYELTGYMRRSALGVIWPRTEASIYREPKILETHGFVTSSVAATGDRKRTVYEITPSGREALRSWLELPAEGFRFECEGAVKAFFADSATVGELRAHLERLAAQPLSGRAPDPTLLDDLLAGRTTFPELLHLSALAGDLIGRVNIAMRDWAIHWLANLDEWTTTTFDESTDRQARAELRSLKRRLATRVRRDGA